MSERGPAGSYNNIVKSINNNASAGANCKCFIKQLFYYAYAYFPLFF